MEQPLHCFSNMLLWETGLAKFPYRRPLNILTASSASSFLTQVQFAGFHCHYIVYYIVYQKYSILESLYICISTT